MDAVLKKWGNSTAVRLPAPVLREAHLAENQTVEIEVQHGKIVISRSSKPPKYDLSDLLSGMTKKNIHAAIEFKPMGNECL